LARIPAETRAPDEAMAGLAAFFVTRMRGWVVS
jgi:hypothetical protein